MKPLVCWIFIAEYENDCAQTRNVTNGSEKQLETDIEDVCDLLTGAGSGYSQGSGRVGQPASERSSSFKPGANRYG